MPVIIAFFVRQFLIIGIQLAMFWIAEKALVPLLNAAIKAVVVFFGVDEETAGDILANEILTTAESLGLLVLLSKAKIPLKITDKLGFSTKGFSKRTLKTTTAAAITKAKTTGIAGKIEAGVSIDDVVSITATTKGFLPQKIKDVMTIIGFTIGLPMGILYTAAQYIDYAAWSSSAYQGTFKSILAVFGIEADKKYTKESIAGTDKLNKIFSVYELQGAVGISNPYKNQSIIFNKNELMDLIDQIASDIMIEKGSASVKQIMAVATAMIIFKSPTGEISIKTPAPTAKATPIVQQIKVFTGIISQGKLSEAPEFTPRPDDLIENVDELNIAIQNNLAPFLASLSRRIIYELKLTHTVTTKDGFKTFGTTQQVIIGYKKDGAPKYKTITNRFAVLNIYVFTERNIRTKISSINLGPVDSAKLMLSQNQLIEINTSIQRIIPTSDIRDIEVLETSTPIIIVAPVAAAPAQIIQTAATPLPAPAPTPLPAPAQILKKEDNYYKVRREGRAFVREKNTDRELADWEISRLNLNINLIEERLPTPAAPVVAAKPASCNASTIAEFYDPAKIKYPSVAERAKIYGRFFPEQEQWYIGTAEQNIKLLTALKQEQSC